MSHFFAYLARMKLIQRWGLMKNTFPENIQEHSLQVAMIAHGLALIRNKYFGGSVDPARVMALAVFHEVSEVFTGDLPTPIKYYNQEMKSIYGSIEEMAKQRLCSMLPAELADEYRPLLFMEPAEADLWRIVKAADKICACLKCVEERKAGNQEFSRAEKIIREEISRIDLPEVGYFMDKFAPSFALTLDEMSQSPGRA